MGSRPESLEMQTGLARPVAFMPPGPVCSTAFAISAPGIVYCHVWSNTERMAFWVGFCERVDEYGEDLLGLFDWLQDSLGFGDEEGDFSKAWAAFGGGLQAIAELVAKLLVVTGTPVFLLRYHPKREQYEQELLDLGIAVTNDLMAGYQKAYDTGGLPQCTGRLLADLVAIAVEVAGSKGAAKAASLLSYNVKSLRTTIKLKKKKYPTVSLVVAAERAGIAEIHAKIFKAVAEESVRMIAVRFTNKRSVALILRGFPGKPLDIKAKTSKKTGIVTAINKKEIDDATSKGFFVLDSNGIAHGKSGVIDLSASKEWAKEAGQVIDPKSMKPFVADYDLHSVIDPKSPGANVNAVPKVEGDSITNPQTEKIRKLLNDRMKGDRVTHGAHDAFGDLASAGDGTVVFFPDGTIKIFDTVADMDGFFKYLKRQTAKGKYKSGSKIDSGDTNVISMKDWKDAKSSK
jgi:hypothetical protein